MPRLQFYADDHLCERLRSIAQKREITVSQLVADVLRNADLEAEQTGLSKQMAEVLDDVAEYVELCRQDHAKRRLFALREAIHEFQKKYPMYIEQNGERVRNSEGGRVGRQFYYLVNRGRVPNVKNTGMLDRARTVLYEVMLQED